MGSDQRIVIPVAGRGVTVIIFDQVEPLTLESIDSNEASAGELLQNTSSPELQRIEKLNREAEVRWESKLSVQNSLTRSLVSFQANKGRAVYRWFKYKEAFSAGLVEYLLNKQRISGGVLLDPFAGSGTALFAAGALGGAVEGHRRTDRARCVHGERRVW